MKRFFVFLIPVVLLSGCQVLATGPSPIAVHLTLQPTGSALQGRDAYPVAWKVENAGQETAYLARCGENPSFAVERWSGSRWENMRAAICMAVLEMAPIPIAAGEILQGTEAVSGAPGRYRLRLSVKADEHQERWHEIVSAEFKIE